MTKEKYNLILDVDSYKVTHFNQYPQNTKKLYAYIEARNLNSEELIFFGLQAFVKKYLLNPITQDDIDEAEKFLLSHIGVFNRDDWEYILNEHGGFLPIEIKSLDEGTVTNKKIPLLDITNTDEKVPWLVTYIETALLRSLWYPSSVATISREIKKIIFRYLDDTCTNFDDQLPFKLHDFGARGVSSYESSRIGGAAHLLNFLGSDTVEGAMFLKDYYDGTDISYSIPASEHSTITAWGKDNENKAHENIINQFLLEGKVIASVIDSYDTFETASKTISSELKEKIINSKGTLVVRPDSGKLPDTIIELLNTLSSEENFGYTLNSKGYKELPSYIRVIQGDGVDKNSIEDILISMKENNYSAANITFGMGGALLQKLDRDTYSFAMKVSAIHDGNTWKDVYKEPSNDKTKNSRRGRFAIVQNDELEVVDLEILNQTNLLKTRYKDGKLYNETDLKVIRNKVEIN
ncbi:nicotinate phosphoribosyltransferase [Acidimicrobiaceae bacterium]|nr:nicotinate phosphoribosyltransferase [Acidimicrobiaceae bacterium]